MDWTMTMTLLYLLLVSVTCKDDWLSKETAEKLKSKAKWKVYEFLENPLKDLSPEEHHAYNKGVELRWDHTNIKNKTDKDNHTGVENLPESFDSRIKWPECVTPAIKQGKCGSCWAISASSVLSDRFCIATNGTVKGAFSIQDLVSCDPNDDSCQFGRMETAWSYLEQTGIVTEECFPYESGHNGTVPSCPKETCKNSAALFIKYKAVKGKSRALSCEIEIKKELMQYGPVQTGFDLYEDFRHYEGGIYNWEHGSDCEGHAVKIVGWGKEEEREYWIVENSWGPTWAEGGYFRIAFGEVLIDSNAYVGYPDTENLQSSSDFLYSRR